MNWVMFLSNRHSVGVGAVESTFHHGDAIIKKVKANTLAFKCWREGGKALL